MTQDNENRYRQKGEFEISGVEPLPQIETTGLGKEKLKGWGMTDEQIEDLGSFSSQFRYDRCAEKIARLSQSNAEVFTSESEDRVNLPKFYDIDGRLDGQCGDIGKQWIIKINESELMVSLNTNRKDGKQIVTCFYTGLSETHFCNEGSNHVWNGLALVNKDGDIEDEVYIDAAFQLISEKGESGYKQKTAIFNANNVESTENAELPIGWVEIGDDSWTGNARGTAVLGISNDFKFSFSIGFVRDKKTLVVKPIINRLNASGDNDYFVLDDNLKMRVSNGVILTQEQEEEIKKLLDEASNINFVKKEPTVNRVNWNKDDIFS